MLMFLFSEADEKKNTDTHGNGLVRVILFDFFGGGLYSISFYAG